MGAMNPFAAPTRHLFFTGKGGVGKTAIACAAAISLADRGKRVLAGSMLLHDDSFAAGSFAVIYPSENEAVASGVSAYRAGLREDATFKAWTMERILEAMTAAGAGAWVEELRARYLGASTREPDGTVVRV
jgi:arsenite-transporting ATPase